MPYNTFQHVICTESFTAQDLPYFVITPHKDCIESPWYGMQPTLARDTDIYSQPYGYKLWSGLSTARAAYVTIQATSPSGESSSAQTKRMYLTDDWPWPKSLYGLGLKDKNERLSKAI